MLKMNPFFQFNFVSLQLSILFFECRMSPTGPSRSSHHRFLRGLRQLHREGSQHALWTRFHLVIFSQSAWKITAIFFIVVTITQLVHDCHYHRHNHYRIINKIIIITILSCYMGNSRCATIAAAYLMIKKDYSATQALQYMRNSRLLVVVMKLEKFLMMSFFTSKLYARDAIVDKAIWSHWW